MKLNPINAASRSHEDSPRTDAGLKVKSHVKAGLGNVTYNNPTFAPVLQGTRPIAVCG